MGAWPSPSFQATLVGPVCAFSQGRAHPRVPHEFLSFPWLWAHLPVMLHPVSAAPGRDGGGRLGSCDQGPEHASLSPSEAGGHGRVWTGWGGPRRSPALGSEYLCPSAASVCMCTYVFVTFLWICFCVSVNRSPNVKARWQGAVTRPHPWGKRVTALKALAFRGWAGV